jgi:L-ribulose-5-phosphate 3-epimerase
MRRREFLKSVGAAALAVGVGGLAAEGAENRGMSEQKSGQARLKKAVVFSMLPTTMSVEERFRLARAVGFDGVEVSPTTDAAERKALRAASEASGVRIHSIIYGGWGAPLSSPDPKVAERGAAEVTAALECARELGAENILLVPAVVDGGQTRYADAYERSQKRIRPLVGTAEKLGVMICVENVWNNFLLSPLEFARYVDEFRSPYLQAYFDVGNVLAFGWPEDWIRTLRGRIRKVHLKDFKRGPREFCGLRDGDANWPEVRKALAEVGYNGYVTAELPGGDEAYLRDVSARMDRIIAGE